MWETWCKGRWHSVVEQMVVIICTALSVIFLSIGLFDLLQLLGTILPPKIQAAWQAITEFLRTSIPLLRKIFG